MLSEDDKARIRILCDSGVVINTRTWTQEQTDYLRMYKQYGYINTSKKEVMNKFLVITENGNAKYAKDMIEAKEQATEAILAGYDKVSVYELKMTAEIEKPKVEFKEV